MKGNVVTTQSVTEAFCSSGGEGEKGEMDRLRGGVVFSAGPPRTKQ